MRFWLHPVAVLAWLSLLGAAAPAPGVLPATAPYLQNGQPGQVTIMWRSPRAGNATTTLSEEFGTQRLRGTIEGASQAEQRFEGLKPGSYYRYRVVQDGEVLGTGRFKSNPGPEATHMRFAVMGDMGSGGAGQRAIAAQMVKWKPEFALAVGDIVYPNGEADLYGPRYFEPYGELVRNAVVYPALGNHDVRTANGAPYLAAFSLPQEPGGERYYAVDYGPARFWAIDTTQPFHPGTPQYQWLAADLEKSTAKWKFAFFHHPAYSSGLHGSNPAVQQHLVPLFTKHKFAAVFAGHDHHYERTYPIHGVTYFVSGGGGAFLYGIMPKPFSAASVQLKHTFMGVTIYENTLAIQALDEHGQTLDAWAMTR
jgi:hypothetical protein